MAKIALESAVSSTNKVIEIMVTLFAIYIFLELNSIPDGCPDAWTDCVAISVNHINASGKDPDLSLIMSPCEEQMAACTKGAIGDLKFDGELATSISNQVDAHKFMIEYCNCLWNVTIGLSENDEEDAVDILYCDFDKFITYALVVGIAVLFGSIMTDSLDYEEKGIARATVVSKMIVRFVALALALLYFVITIIIFNKGFECNSNVFDDKAEVVYLLTGFGAGLVGGSGGFELLIWIEFLAVHAGKKEEKKEEPKKEEAK